MHDDDVDDNIIYEWKIYRINNETLYALCVHRTLTVYNLV